MQISINCKEWVILVNDMTKHINYQYAYRCLYYGWNSNSVDNPMAFLCIIHKKMDHTKSAIPQMQRTSKVTFRLGHIPIYVIGMLKHGHGDGTYAHYLTAFWHGDSNFTISSICQVLTTLEQPPIKDSKELFIVPLQNSFFDAFIYGKSKSLASILAASTNMIQPPLLDRSIVPLPKKLFLQFDNSTKNNKNRYIMAFCLLLIAGRIFKEVMIGFLIVNHTHIDIDA